MPYSNKEPGAAEMQVQFAISADAHALAHIEQQCYAQPWSAHRFIRECENPNSYILLLRNQKSPMAYLCFWHLGPEVEIHNVACAPKWRRLGAAQTLMNHLLDWCRVHHVEQIFLEVRSSNRGAIALYHSFGFTSCGRRTGYYTNGEDALLMCCNVG
jgi:ribosomal-protein-alanine N-acetyltransferase